MISRLKRTIGGDKLILMGAILVGKKPESTT